MHGGGRDNRGPLQSGGRQQGPRRDGRGGVGGGGGSSSAGMFRYDSEFDFESANARFNKEVLEEKFKQTLNIDDHISTHSKRISEGNEGNRNKSMILTVATSSKIKLIILLLLNT